MQRQSRASPDLGPDSCSIVQQLSFLNTDLSTQRRMHHHYTPRSSPATSQATVNYCDKVNTAMARRKKALKAVWIFILNSH
eukprot:7705020-Ditylum_brightwellii.AAC.1